MNPQKRSILTSSSGAVKRRKLSNPRNLPSSPLSDIASRIGGAPSPPSREPSEDMLVTPLSSGQHSQSRGRPDHDRDGSPLSRNEDEGNSEAIASSPIRRPTALSGLFNMVRNELKSNINGLESRILSKISALEEKQEDMSSNIEGMSAGTAGSGRTGPNVGNPSAPRVGGMSEVRRTLNALTPHDDLIADSQALSKVASVAVPAHIVAIATDESDDFTKSCAFAIAICLFGKPSGKAREVLQEGVGLRHCALRKSMALTLVCNLNANKFGIFRDTAIAGTQSPTSESEDPRPLLPSWLGPRFISEKIVGEAGVYYETVPESRKDAHIRKTSTGKRVCITPIGVREKPTNMDIAIHGARKLYSLVIRFLHDCREHAKISFADNLGYLLVGWASVRSTANQDGLHLRLSDRTEGAAMTSVEAIASMARQGEEGEIGANTTKYRQLLNDLPGMVLTAEYDVVVYPPGGTSRKKVGRQNRKITRSIHLVEVALRFMVDFCRLKTEEEYLHSSEGSLRAVFAIAVVFRKLVQEFLSRCTGDRRNGGKVMVAEIPSGEDVSVGVVSLSLLMPGSSTLKRAVDGKTLISERMFANQHVGGETLSASGTDSPDRDEAEQVNEPILPSVRNGIFQL